MDPKQETFSITLPILLAVLVIGVSSGLIGMFLVLLLHYVEHLAYGYSQHVLIGPESFLVGVSAASPQRRVIVLSLCGVIAGLGWFLIYRYGKPLVEISAAVKSNPARMPRFKTVVHALLQIITVGMGSPLGREKAPREAAAVFASWMTSKMGLSLSDMRVMTACAAGAGLAAIYNVPLAGTMFTLETLLHRFTGSLFLVSLMTSVIAVMISWIGLGNVPQYHLSSLHIHASLLLWSVMAGPLLGYLAHRFIQVANAMQAQVKHNWQVPALCLLNFVVIGILAVYFPQLLGNGKSPAQLEFNDAIGFELSLILLILRVLITWSSMRAGAHGGVLTPSLANGALAGVVLGSIWLALGFDISMSAFALVGAAAFLAVAQKMPVTAVLLIFEFTYASFDMFLPIVFAVAGAVKMGHVCQKRQA